MFRWLAIFLLLWFIYQVRHVFPPIIVGGIFAYLILPVVQTLCQKAKLPIGLATTLVYSVIGSLLVGAIWLLEPAIGREIRELSDPHNQQEVVRNAVEQIANICKLSDQQKSDLTAQVFDGLKHLLIRPEELGKGVGEISHLALSCLVCVVSSIYFTLDYQSVGRFFLRYVPEERKAGIIDLFAQMNRMLSRYVQGQLLLILIMSVVAWLFLHFGLAFLGFGNGLKYALPVAVLSGFLEIIPVLGPILATGTATLFGIAQFGPAAALATIIFYTLARWIEDYVVVPKVIGHAVELHPLAVIFAVLCGETLAGALGMLIAIPVAASIKLTLDYFYTGQLPFETADQRKKQAREESGQSPGKQSISARIKQDAPEDKGGKVKIQDANASQEPLPEPLNVAETLDSTHGS